MTDGYDIPYYYKANACDTTAQVYTDCPNHNYFKPNEGSGSYAYTESENIGFFLNNATNSFYNWLSDSVKSNILVTDWNLSVGGSARDYVESLFNFDYIGEYPNRTNDGKVSAKIGLPQWGDMFSGNDLNNNYWYINRWRGSTFVSYVIGYGYSEGTHASYRRAARPVFYLKSSVKVT